MLTIAGRARSGYCDGVTRRDFLKIGGLALGGLSLPQLLQAEAQAGISRSHKAVIMIFLAGGPPHHGHVRHEARCSHPASGANTSRSRPMCRASTSASTCRGWRR